MPYTSRTLADLRTQLKARWDNVPFWSDEEARLALNEGLLLWNLLTGTWRERITLTTRPDDQFIALPAPLLWPTQLLWNNKPLDKASLAQLSSGQPGWQGQTTADGGNIPMTVKAWAPVSLKLLAIWPRDGAGGGTLTVDGIADTPQLVDDADDVDLSSALDGVLLSYALHIMAFKGPTFSDTQDAYRAFIQAAGDENAQFKASSLYRKILGLNTQQLERPLRKAAS